MKRKKHIPALIMGAALLIAGAVFVWKTHEDLRPLPKALSFEAGPVRKVQVLEHP
jgi:ABC-type enterobactin transport system permease subunit